jgi:IS5 family transposase
MRSKRPERKGDGDLYRARLDDLLDHRHEQFQLAERMNWDGFEEAFGKFYKPPRRRGWPAKNRTADHQTG